jgi:hypothetical protein
MINLLCAKSMIECISFCNIFSAILGGVIGLLLVFLVEWIKKPRVKFGGFKKEELKNCKKKEYLYKILVVISGCTSPGYSELYIKWKDKSGKNKSVKAKWDELPNPINDAMIPSTTTYLVIKKGTYYIPVIHEDVDGNLTIFSGWWFFRDSLKDDVAPVVEDSLKMEFEFVSQNKIKTTKKFTVKEIVEKSR